MIPTPTPRPTPEPTISVEQIERIVAQHETQIQYWLENANDPLLRRERAELYEGWARAGMDTLRALKYLKQELDEARQERDDALERQHWLESQVLGLDARLQARTMIHADAQRDLLARVREMIDGFADSTWEGHHPLLAEIMDKLDALLPDPPPSDPPAPKE